MIANNLSTLGVSAAKFDNRLDTTRTRGIHVNAEWIHLNHCPVGYTAVPYPVGGNGEVFHMIFETTF